MNDISKFDIKDRNYTINDLEIILKHALRIKKETEIMILKKKSSGAINISPTMKYNDFYHLNSKTEWDLPENLFDLDDFEPRLLRIPRHKLELIKQQLDLVTFSVGSLSPSDSLSKRTRLIDAFIDPALQLFDRTLIKKDIETTELINNSHLFLDTPIGYKLEAFSDIIYIVLIVRKYTDHQSIYGRMMAELFKAWEQNKHGQSVCGVVTTGFDWYWWRYDGQAFSASKEATQLSCNNPKSLPLIASKIYSIVTEIWLDRYGAPLLSIHNPSLQQELWDSNYNFNNNTAEVYFSRLGDLIFKAKKDYLEFLWHIVPEYM